MREQGDCDRGGGRSQTGGVGGGGVTGQGDNRETKTAQGDDDRAREQRQSRGRTTLRGDDDRAVET